MTESTAIRPLSHRYQHDIIFVPERDRDHQQERPARVETQTQIDRLERRKSITEDQAEAGRKYYTDAYYAGVVPRGRVSVGDRVSGSCEDASEEAINRHIAVKDRRAKAIRALGELVSIAEWVCVDDYPAESWAIRRREHPRAGIAIARVMLTTLAKHYGLTKVTN